MSKRAYRGVLVKNVEVEGVLSRLSVGALWIGMDVGKSEVFVVVRDSAGVFERPWKVKLPFEIPELVSRLKALQEQRGITIAMESTGTYGEALRQSLTDAELAVRRVRSQATSDYAEIFDGVPSQHDGKDAAMLAELGAIGKSASWPSRVVTEETAALKAQVQWLTAQQSIWQTWQGRLEGLVSKFWPEATRVMSLQSMTLLRVLRDYGGPRGLAADVEGALKLAKWGRQKLTAPKIATLLASAGETLGVRMTLAEEAYVRRCAESALEAGREMRQARRELEKLVQGNPILERMSESVGACTACVLFATVGDPREYHCGAAYRKALGLNLKERSSGQQKGQLKITKRGPSAARRWLFFAALRHAQSGPVRPWFEAKKKKDKDRGLGAVVAIMRKLALAVHATVTRDEPFLLARLLPGKPWRTPRDATNTNSKNNAVALKKSDIKKSDIKKSDIKKEDIKKEDIKKEDIKTSEIKPSRSELPRRPKSRLPLQPLSLPLPT